MFKLLVPAVAVVAFSFAGLGAEQAEAGGFHFSSGRVHVDVGTPHRSYYVQPSYSSYYYQSIPRSSYYGGGYGWGGGPSCYNQGHYDYHAPSYQWHGNHFDYMPGHYDYHQGGHHGGNHHP